MPLVPFGLHPLIAEAKRRARRRRSLVTVTALAVAGAVGLAYELWPAPSTSEVAPDQPTALAISSDGHLYIGDRGRNQILEWTPPRGFRIVAGTGRAGLTGDGGLAVRARLDGPGSLLVASDGALYFTQTGRYRAPVSSSGGMVGTTVIREVTPAGTIHTIAGLHPRCASGPARSIPAESALFDGASLSLSPGGALAVDAGLCVGKPTGPGFGPNLLLNSSGRFVEELSNPVPAVAAVDCGSDVPGPGFHVFACASGGAAAGHPHPAELVVVRSDGSAVSYPDYRGGDVASGGGEVVATYDDNLVRVTSRRLVPLLTSRELARALHIPFTAIRVGDIYAPTVDGRGDVYFVASALSRSGCQNRILERTAGGAIRQVWASSTSRNNTCA